VVRWQAGIAESLWHPAIACSFGISAAVNMNVHFSFCTARMVEHMQVVLLLLVLHDKASYDLMPYAAASDIICSSRHFAWKVNERAALVHRSVLL
jgi:hypothetical protein